MDEKQPCARCRSSAGGELAPTAALCGYNFCPSGFGEGGGLVDRAAIADDNLADRRRRAEGVEHGWQRLGCIQRRDNDRD
jgi:hypothetical protein